VAVIELGYIEGVGVAPPLGASVRVVLPVRVVTVGDRVAW